MSYTSDNFSIPVPSIFKKAIHSLLLPGERLEDILDEVGGYRFPGFELEKSIWHSKTMTIEKKKPKTLDMFFSKIKKEEHGDYEGNSSISDTSEVTQGSPETLTQNENKKKTTEKNAKYVMNSASVKDGSFHTDPSPKDNSPGHSIINSPIHSQDMFAEERISSKKEYHSSPEKSILPKAVEDLGSDEEIIPSSQAPSDANMLSLSNSIRSEITQKSSPISNKGKEFYKLPNEPVRKKSFLSRSKRQTLSPRNDSSLSEEEYSKRSSFSETNPINNSMKKINEIFSEINPEDTWNHSDLTEDDEVYVIQCPSEIDLKELKGLKLPLLDDSIISIGSEENNKYDCCLVKETSNRNLYVALPDSDKKEMKIGTIPLAGNIILSENLNIPYNKSVKDLTEVEHEFVVPDESYNNISKKKKKKRRSYEDSTQDEHELSVSDVAINDIPKKKKKKHSSNEDYSTQDEHELSISDVTITDIPKKKKKKRSTYADSTQDEHELSVSDVAINDIPKKKKKKHSSNEDYSTQDEHELSVSDVAINDIPKKKKKKHSNNKDYSTQDEHELSVSDVATNNIPKKKKKKHNTYEDETQDETEASECFSKSATEDVLNKLISKRKKKNRRTLENDEINSTTTLDDFLNIKTEWEEPQVDSGYQETPSKHKKRKRDIEDSVVHREEEEEITIKKKKKKHRHSGSQHSLSPSQED